MPGFDQYGSGQDRQQPGTSGQWGGDYSGQLNDMLAPYQKMAEKFSSPYATMNQNSWLAKNHPQVAGILDNAFLTAGSTPVAQGPEGVGGGIARTMQGLMGGQQYQRQRMMQQAMLPYQMLQPRLQAEDMMSQIQERHGSALRAEAYNEAMVNRFGPGGLESQKIDVAQQRADQAKYGRVLNTPEERFAYARHPFKDPQNPTDEELGAVQKEYEKIKSTTQRTPAGSYEEQIANLRMFPPGTPERVEGERRWADHISTLQAGSGARTQGMSDVTEPAKNLDKFYENERQTAYSTLAKPQSTLEYHTTHEFDKDYYKLSGPEKDARYDLYLKGEQGKKQQVDINLTKWKRSSAFPKGVSYSEYMQDPSKWDASTPTQAPASVTSTKPVVNKNWTYTP